MKKTILKVSIVLLCISTGSSVFSQEMPKFSNPEEKEAWIKAHPTEYEQIMLSEKKTQSTGEATKVDFSNLPKFVDTGNPTLDAENYHIAKSKWKAEHPDLYPENEAQAAEQKKSLSISDSPGYPKYVDTGNPTLDSENYHVAKTKWIAEHPELYPKREVETPEQKTTPSIADLPGFPKLMNTGNPDEDHARYQAAKASWYAENKEIVEEYYRTNVSTNTQQTKP